MQQKDELLKVQDVADRLHVNARTVLRLVERGELEAVKVAHSWRFPPHAIDAYLWRNHKGSSLAPKEEESPDDEAALDLANGEPLTILEQRLKLEKDLLELDTRRFDYILEKSQKMIDSPDIDEKTKARLTTEFTESLLHQLLELGKGRASERGSHPIKQNRLDLRSAFELDKA